MDKMDAIFFMVIFLVLVALTAYKCNGIADMLKNNFFLHARG